MRPTLQTFPNPSRPRYIETRYRQMRHSCGVASMLAAFAGVASSPHQVGAQTVRESPLQLSASEVSAVFWQPDESKPAPVAFTLQLPNDL
ncbi:MAG TPA: hypothetical protein VF719_01920, partial [Abditibacteriaceae bacterium]